MIVKANTDQYPKLGNNQHPYYELESSDTIYDDEEDKDSHSKDNSKSESNSPRYEHQEY